MRPRPSNTEDALLRLNDGNRTFAELLNSVTEGCSPIRRIVQVTRGTWAFAGCRAPSQRPFERFGLVRRTCPAELRLQRRAERVIHHPSGCVWTRSSLPYRQETLSVVGGPSIRTGLSLTKSSRTAATYGCQALLTRLLKKQGIAPKRMVTDKLRSYGAARRQVMPHVEHRSHKGLNNRAENSHETLRKRERMMQGFRSPGGLQRFVSVFAAVRNLFVPPRSQRSRIPKPRSTHPGNRRVESCGRSHGLRSIPKENVSRAFEFRVR